MNRIRRAVLICYALAVALACVWVPWRGPGSEGITEFLGYGWIWSGPTGPKTPEYYTFSIVDYGRIALELLAFTAVSGIAFLATPGRANFGTVAVSEKSEPIESGVWTPPQLPDPSDMPEGRIALDPKTRRPLAKVQGGKWVAP